MSNARYVFFRDSNGRASKPVDGPTHLLSQIGMASFLHNGEVSWKNWDYRRRALLSSFVITEPGGPELNDRDTEAIVWKALGDLARKAPGSPLTGSEVLRTADHHAAAFFRQPHKEYVLVTSLSVSPFPGTRIRIRDSAIMPLKARRAKYPLPKALRLTSHFSEHLNSSRYQVIGINTRGRSVFEGADTALADLNLLRGIWSLGTAILGRWTIQLGGGPRRAAGIIHTGPVHTLHNLDGSPATDNYYWFDPEYTRDLELFRITDEQWRKLERYRRWATKRIANLPYGKEMVHLFSRYITALDHPNPNVAFLHLWIMLEKITDTVGRPYEETIKRSCWIFSKAVRPIRKEELEALRHHRNRYVHSGETGEESREVIHLAKSFVDPHLIHLLNNTYKVQSLREYAELLSYSTDRNTAERTRHLSSMALLEARKDLKEED